MPQQACPSPRFQRIPVWELEPATTPIGSEWFPRNGDDAPQPSPMLGSSWLPNAVTPLWELKGADARPM